MILSKSPQKRELQRCGNSTSGMSGKYVFGLLDPDPDPLVRGMAPDLVQDLSIIKQKK
jgi:hypothetical protein